MALGDKFLEDWNLNVWMDFIFLDHVTREEVNHFRVGHPLIVEGVNLLQQEVDILFTLNHAHPLDQLAELRLVDDTICVSVNTLVQISEFLKELLMLQKLKVEDDLLEIRVEDRCLSGNRLTIHLEPSHLLWG